MSGKFYFILIFSLVFLLSVGVISAADNDTDVIRSSQDDIEINSISDDLSYNEDTLSSCGDDLKDLNNSLLTTDANSNNEGASKDISFLNEIDQSENFNLSTTQNENNLIGLQTNTSYLGDSGSDSNTTDTSTSQKSTSIVVKSTSVVRGNYLTVYLRDSDGNPISSQSVTFTLKGKTYSKTTDSNGVAKLKITLKTGKYKIKITYAGGTLYTGSSKTTTIKLYKIGTKITPSSKSVVRGKTFKITLKTKSGKVLKGQKIIFKISNKKYKKTTNSKGKASVTIKLKAKKTYTMKVTYKGTTSYVASSKKVKLTVKASSSKSSSSSSSTGKFVVNGKTVTKKGKTYSTSSSNTNTVLVKNGGKLTIKNSKIIKKGSVSNSKAESSDFYGTNAAVLVTAKSTLYISNSQITTNAKGANAIFVSNLASSKSGATAYVSDVVINTYKDKSRGLDATYGGKIVADSVTIKTRGGSCAALATDRGEGTIIASNCKLYTGVGKTSGSGSPLIYSTGSITVSKSTGTSYVSQIACVEGKNSITLTDCDFTGYGKGNRYVSGSYVDNAGVFIYQSMSGDADTGLAKFSATNTKLTVSSDSSYYKSAPMFYVTNTDANINLNGCTLTYGSGVLLKAAGQSQWGKSGSNGGDVTFTASNMKLTGNIVIDKISSLKLTLTNTNYSGAVNPSSSYGTTKLVINSGSTWSLTGNSHVTSLSNSGTINYGSYTLYVNGVAYTASNPYTG